MNDKITLKNKATVLVTPELQSEITVLHNQCPKNKEWSGLLVYKVTKGDINDLINDVEKADVELTCEHVFLMDFGDATFTSFTGSEDWITFFGVFPQVDPLRSDKNNGYYVGKLHSHHNMDAFHSSTDTGDLIENAPKLPMFLSLVCNYNCNPFAEIAVAYQVELETKTKEKKSMKLWKWFGADQDEVVEKEEKIVKDGTIIIPCDVRYQTNRALIEQLAVIRERNKPPVSTAITHYGQQTGFQYGQQGQNHYMGGNLKDGYSAIKEDLADLIVLGNTTTKMFPYEAMMAASIHTNQTNMYDYCKAFKEYFNNYWFPVTFRGTKTTKEEVLNAIIQWTIQHNKIWVAKQIKTSCDELKKELTVLR